MSQSMHDIDQALKEALKLIKFEQKIKQMASETIGKGSITLIERNDDPYCNYGTAGR
jgi:hypothetical protein